jgi:molybdate transport system substrate-binding protein
VCRLLFAAALALSCHPTKATAQTPGNELRIAAASDLQPVLPTLAAEFATQSHVHVVTTFGSSASLAQQLQNGAPEDLFLSADCSHPQQLIQANLAADSAPVPYATGVLVMWARRDSPAQPLSLDAFTRQSVTRVAVANALHAPYGQAAAAEIQALGLSHVLAPKLVTGENIMQTAQFAETGNAQVALISLTIASSPHYRETGTYFVLPRKYPPIVQCGVTLRSSSDLAAAHNFLHWLTSSQTQARLRQFGLEPVR